MTKDGAKERARILAILEAHKRDLPGVYLKLVNLINSGVDLAEEAKRPKSSQALGIHWPEKTRKARRRT